jgi:FtsP/CotA-like multicopper oxidase with cupredoxin domain
MQFRAAASPGRASTHQRFHHAGEYRDGQKSFFPIHASSILPGRIARRCFLTDAGGLSRSADAASLAAFLSDPAAQPKFVNHVPNALAPGFKFTPIFGEYTVGVGPTTQETGLVNPGGKKLKTKLFGYGQNGEYTWPGKTFEVQRGASNTIVTALPGQVKRIKATFDKPGRYVWHCHIPSHEDHEMMCVLQVGE